MAAGGLSAPGTEYGPCVDKCEHTDCASTRRMAEQKCEECPEPIGYDRDFFHIEGPDERPWSRLVHATCEGRK